MQFIFALLPHGKRGGFLLAYFLMKKIFQNLKKWAAPYVLNVWDLSSSDLKSLVINRLWFNDKLLR